MSANPSFEDFISPIDGFYTLPMEIQSDLIAYFLLKDSAAVGAADIAAVRSAAHLAPFLELEVHLFMSASSHKGKAPTYIKDIKAPHRIGYVYVLESSYERHLESKYLGRPTAAVIKKTLRQEFDKITDPAIRDYMDETIKCFEHKLYRSSIVMSWCVAYGTFRKWVFDKHLPELNKAWKKPIKITSLDDFQEIPEALVVDTAYYEAKILPKETWKKLKELLNVRNTYAHPSNVMITPSIAEAYIENTLHNILPKLTE
jgi:hypothetical protein